MRVCVCGWYWTDEIHESLLRVNRDYPVFVVFHKQPDSCELPHTVIQNIGLEWHTYNEYLHYFWPGVDDVVFMHDDIEFAPFLDKNYEVQEGEKALAGLVGLACDQAYVFPDHEYSAVNFGKHGRMVWMSRRFLTWAKKNGGFWFDANNTGWTGGGEKPEGCKHYNAAIDRFHIQAQGSGLDVHRKVFIPAFQMGRRGIIEE
jgi:hypothetical protein